MNEYRVGWDEAVGCGLGVIGTHELRVIRVRLDITKAVPVHFEFR